MKLHDKTCKTIMFEDIFHYKRSPWLHIHLPRMFGVFLDRSLGGALLCTQSFSSARKSGICTQSSTLYRQTNFHRRSTSATTPLRPPGTPSDSLLWENVREWSIRVPAVQTDRSSLRVSRTLPGHCRAAEPRVGDGGRLRAVAMGVMPGDRDRLELHLHPQFW